jgi:uncharacterized protein YwqG
MGVMDDKDKRKAEVRAKLEQEAASKQKKKSGFMTPARKKKLRMLIRKMAAEENKKLQEQRAAERKRIIEERAGAAKDVSSLNEAELLKVASDFKQKVDLLEADKYDLEYEAAKRDFQVRELRDKVSHRPGKFPKPTLKKVSKTANQMEKILMFTAKISQQNYRTGLKVLSVSEKPETKLPEALQAAS